MAKVEQDIEVEIDIPKSLKFKKPIGKIKYKLHEEEIKLIIDIKKIGKEIKNLQEQLKEANDLLKGLYDDSPCQFDHNGYCQEHGSTDGNYICVQGELKEYLERYDVK